MGCARLHFSDKYITMPRLSLWKPQKANDYRFIDRTVSEMFTVGATDLYVHKYLGSNNPAGSTDLTQPHYDTLEPTNIQDLLFLENRDRKYDANIYRLRGHYNVQNLDFDLSQFGLFLTNDILFLTVHYNDMIDIIGRKLMVGDVFELPHLTDFHPLNEAIPIGLRRYYQVTDANFASEGFSQTWYPHLWRIKCEPLVDSQEFADIMYEPINKDNYMGDWDATKTYEPGYTVKYGDKVYTPTQSVPAGTAPPDPLYWELSTELNLTDIIGRYNKNIAINQANIDEAKRLVPKSGYDRSQLYVAPTFDNDEPAIPTDIVVPQGAVISSLTISSISSPLYKNSSKVLRIPKGKEIIETLKLQSGLSISLQNAMSAPERTDGGSGAMVGDKILLVSSLGLTIDTPYGTADNTYATADQFVKFIATALATPANSTTISLLSIPEFLVAGLVLRATVFSENGTPTYIFPEGSRVVSVNTLANTIVVSQAINGSIPAGTAIEMSYDFNGVVTPVMDYLADCDPRFQYIRRSSPRSFGYLAGYLAGDDQAPNGYPMGAGTSFPAAPLLGDYFMRLDYLPQKLFRFNGKMWVEISRNVRTDIGFTEDDKSQLSTFINNTAVVTTAQGGVIPSRQSLSNVLKIQPD
jgi:hypothetical protein